MSWTLFLSLLEQNCTVWKESNAPRSAQFQVKLSSSLSNKKYFCKSVFKNLLVSKGTSFKFQRKEISQNFGDNLLVAYQSFKSEVMFLTLDTFQNLQIQLHVQIFTNFVKQCSYISQQFKMKELPTSSGFIRDKLLEATSSLTTRKAHISQRHLCPA